MQQSDQTNVAALLDHLVTEAIPDQHGVAAWQSLIRAHATLMHQLTTDLVEAMASPWATSMPWPSSGRPAASDPVLAIYRVALPRVYGYLLPRFRASEPTQRSNRSP